MFFSKTKGDMKYLFKKNNELTLKGRKRKKRARSTMIGLILVLIQIVFTALFLFRLFNLDLLPFKYITIVNVILLLLTLYNFLSQFTRTRLLGKILAILLSVAMLLGYRYSDKLYTTLAEISNSTVKTDIVDVIVLKSDSANSIQDTLSYTYGYNTSDNDDVLKRSISDINKDNNTTVNTKEYSSWDDVINDLYNNKNIRAMVITDSMRATLLDQYDDFDARTKIVGTVKIRTEIKLSASDKKVNEEPFIIYLSGNDGYGEVTSTGRSDVNILAVVNPKTRQILLISTPRDSYINITNSNGKKGLDKLTHAGNAGIEYSMSALNELYGIDIDYYLKINFTGCVKIVDALGGITINSEYEFENGYEAAPKTYHFNVGENECDGEKTLAFVRERKFFKLQGGDLQRGRNQEAAIQGIIAKATSPKILESYNSVLDAVSDMMLTNMSPATMTALIRGQLSDSTSWNIQSYNIDGKGETRDCLVYGLKQKDVVLLYDYSVDIAKEMINKIYNGETFNVDEYVSEHASDNKSTTISGGNSQGTSNKSNSSTTTSGSSSSKSGKQ